MNCRRVFCPSETGKATVVEQNFFRNTREAGIPVTVQRSATGRCTISYIACVKLYLSICFYVCRDRSIPAAFRSSTCIKSGLDGVLDYKPFFSKIRYVIENGTDRRFGARAQRIFCQKTVSIPVFVQKQKRVNRFNVNENAS